MAEEIKRRGRKTTTQEVEETTTTNDLENELEKANLEKSQMADMIKQMQEQLAFMQQQINSQNSNNGNVIIQQNDNITRTVKVISMLGHTYNMSTQPYGQGKIYTFENFGESKNIRFSDMQEILTVSLKQFEDGFAILADKKDYDDLGIGYIADNVLDFDKMKDIVKLKTQASVDTILNLSDEMQEQIADIIAQNIANGVSYDYNKVKILEDEGLQINERAELFKASNE